MTFLASALLSAPFLLGVALTWLTARRTRPAWEMKRRLALERGYRDVPAREGRVLVRPKGLVPSVGLAVAIGCTAFWSLALAIGELSTTDSPGWLGVVFALALAALLATISGAGLSLVARRPGSTSFAHAVGGAAVVLGLLVVLPILAWPQWFGGTLGRVDAHLVFAALGLFAIVGGAVLARAAWLTQTAELEITSEPTLFDPA